MIYVGNLPDDIQLHISSYIYSPQPKNLCEDIKQYVYFMERVKEIYYHIFVVKRGEDTQEAENWLLNDIFAYGYSIMNLEEPASNMNVHTIWKRHFMMKNWTNWKIDDYFILFEKKPVITQIRVFLGLMKPDERNECLFQGLFFDEIGTDDENVPQE